MRQGRVPRLRPIAALALCSVLAACGHLRDIGNEIRAELFNRGPLAQAGPPPPPPPDRADSTPLTAVPELKDILDTPPTASGAPPEWPRVVITSLRVRMDDSIDQIVNPGLTAFSPPPAQRCVFFDVLVWRSAQWTDVFPDLSLCAHDLRGGPTFSAFLVWNGRRTCGETTGRERTDGPLPPDTPLPDENPTFQSWLRYDGPHFLVRLLEYLGHRRSADPCHRRFWIVAYDLIDWEPSRW